MLTRAALLLSTTLLGGCLPIPHLYQDLPRIEGTIRSGEAPVAGARVQVTDVHRANPCEHAEQAATTDAAGRFITPGRRRFRIWMALPMAHSIDSWAAAIVHDGQTVGYVYPRYYRAGPRYAPREVELTCDLTTRACAVHNRDSNLHRAVTLRPCVDFPRNIE